MKEDRYLCLRNLFRNIKKAFFIGLLVLMAPHIVHSMPTSSRFEDNYNINLSFKNETLENVIKEIAKQANVRIIYSYDQVDSSKRINANIQTTDIQKALETVLGDDYAFKQEGNYITIVEKKASFVPQATQQKKRVSGLLTDGNGDPLIGVTVTVKGSNKGITSDMDGKYTLENVKNGDVLEYRYIGFVTEERIYKGERTINIRMMEASVGLDDVVVIGYGQQKKESVVSSINTIGPAELAIKQRNLKNTLAGQIAGVIAIQRSREPGNDASAFFIRGQSSYAGGVNPLVLVDGIPRSMDDIDVDEIESFTVLKDAAATAVYGAEGANGVVLITSKRGKVQKTQVNFSAQYSIVTPTRMPETLNSYDYMSMYNEAVWNTKGNPDLENYIPHYSTELLEKYRNGEDPDLYPSVDWFDLLKKHTQSQRYTINFRGGSDKVRYFASGSYYKEDGIFESNSTEKYNANIGLQRFNLRSNIDMDLSKSTLLSIDMSGQYTMKNQPGFSSDDIFAKIAGFPVHVIPMSYSDGTASDHYNNGKGTDYQPYNMLNHSGYMKTWSAFLQTKVTLKQKLDFITKGLSVRGTVSFDADFYSTMKRDMKPESFYAEGRNEDGSLKKKKMKDESPLSNPSNNGTNGVKKIYLEAALDYNRTFNKVHNVTGTLLYMQKETQWQNRKDLQLLPYRKQSVVARATYGYDNRYMIEASAGMTGSENFSDGNRWGIFPAVGVAWYVSHERFMEGISDYISKLKLRASYGITGNDEIGASNRFPYHGSINTKVDGYNFGLVPGLGGYATNYLTGVVEGNFALPGLSWEIEKKLNIGIDLGLFNGRVDLSADYFFNRRSDILLQRKTVSQVTGFRNMPFQNFGIVDNRGIDASLVLKQRIGQVSLSARGNITYAKNKIKEYDEEPQRFDYQNYTGNSIGDDMLYIADGLYTPDDFDITTAANGAQTYRLKEGMPVPAALVAPGDIKYKDLNEDGVINGYDRTYKHGFYNDLPEIVYGFGLNAEWKGFFAGVFFQGAAHSSMSVLASMPFAYGVDSGSVRQEVSNHWRASDPYNQNVLYPRLHDSHFAHNTLPSTWWQRDAGFLRLKNIEIGYEFNEKALRALRLKNLRLYLQGNNIAVWDNIKFWDPELGGDNLGAKYPLSSNYTIGIEVTF